MDGALILPNQVLIAVEMDVYFDSIGIMIGFYIVISGISTLIFGYLTDLISRKHLLLFAGFLWSSISILHIFIEDFWHLFALRMIAAIATGVTTPIAFSYLADIVSSDSRSKAFAWWGLITMLGGLIAGAVALSFNRIDYHLIDTESGSISENISYISTNYSHLVNTWRYPFLILGIVALILTIFSIFLTKEIKRGVSEKVFEDLKEEELHYSYKIKLSDFKLIFTRRSNFFLVMNCFDVVASGLLIAFIFPYINLEMGISFGDPEGLIKVIILLLIAAPAAFLFGQFGLAYWADKKVKGGQITARIRVATISSILHLPFLLAAFAMAPNVRTSSFFFGLLSVDEVGFWVLWIIFAILLGLGLAFTFGIAPNWYSSLIDVNLPEHRGTMIATASFIDTIGRALGAIAGGIFIVLTDSISGTIFWAILIFGIFSLMFWIPLFYTCEKDYQEVYDIMTQRAEVIKERIDGSSADGAAIE